MTTLQPEHQRVASRRMSPPKLISVYNGHDWVPEQLLAWRVVTGGCRCLVRPAHILGYVSNPVRWVDAHQVRPREIEGTDPPDSAAVVAMSEPWPAIQ